MSTETSDRPPSVDAVIAAARRELDGSVAHDALADAARSVVAAERDRLAGGAEPSSVEQLADEAARRELAALGDVPLATVINATGVIVHTNLGRAPWPPPRSRPRAAPPATTSCSSSTARPAGAVPGSAWPRSTSSR